MVYHLPFPTCRRPEKISNSPVKNVCCKQKKTKKERQKEEQVVVEKAKKPVPVEPVEDIEEVSVESSQEADMPEVFDYEQMREDYGW